MRIKRLEIYGFKSFVDRTVFRFDEDIIGIVGPNGCGKSNIVDAIRWVMGEQSAKHLRGGTMEDVIFSGSEDRGPQGFAEVALTFDNASGNAPPEYKDFGEITVMRRVDRSAESEYFINQVPVRLMDVTQLFLGTGVGTKAYSIIEQGRVGLIVSAKAKDRRHFIEEAAGVTKFKSRKRAAERKMDHTRQNLLRLKDVVAELEKSLASLKRQAQKAEKFRQYRSELRDLELHEAAHRWLDLTVTEKAVASDLLLKEAELREVRASVKAQEVSLQGQRAELLEEERRLEKAQVAAFESENAVHLLESQIAHYLDQIGSVRERESSLDRELETLQLEHATSLAEHQGLELALARAVQEEKHAAEELRRVSEELEHKRAILEEASTTMENCRSRLQDSRTLRVTLESQAEANIVRRSEAAARLTKVRQDREALLLARSNDMQALEELRARLEGLQGGKTHSADKRRVLVGELADLRARLLTIEHTMESLRGQLVQKRSRLSSLEEIQRKFEGMESGTRAIMTRYVREHGGDANAHVVGLIADRIGCPEPLTAPLAAALGERLQVVVLDDLAGTADAVRYLSEGKHGRASFVAQKVMPAPSLAVPADASVIGKLTDMLSYEDSDRALVEHLLGNVLLVDDLSSALRLYRLHGPVFGYATRGGEYLSPDGVLTGGSEEQRGTHLLEFKRDIRILKDAVLEKSRALATIETEHSALRRQVAEQEAADEAARTEAHEADLSVMEVQTALRHTEEVCDGKEHQLQSLSLEEGTITLVLEECDHEESRFATELGRIVQKQEDIEQELSAAVELVAERKRAEDQQAIVVTDERVKVARAQQKRVSDENVRDRLVKTMRDLEDRRARLLDEQTEGQRKQEEFSARVVQAKDKLAQRKAQLEEQKSALEAARGRSERSRETCALGEQALRELRETIDQQSAIVGELALERREKVLAIEHLIEQMQERHQVDVRDTLLDYHGLRTPDEEAHARAGELNRLLSRMGEVNLLAISEYDEQSLRYEDLGRQQQDLEVALEQLDKAIRKMNRESRKLFKVAFDAVNERFQRIFPAMFGGGTGELTLTDPDDLLETGVEIMAKPPGKRINTLELMSGGEKALTAVSLIFAIFQYKPSPFCLLDEVDAPLDEANIDRFGEAIRSMSRDSQFIIITHSRRSMELADRLYGVTMEVPGVSKVVSVQLRHEDKADVTRKRPLQETAPVSV
ncbi:MAG: chromosome segregation protein SMC [Myxococcales bacterium]|nr:chromosome segregation protein SMC [Myxococcales bacterium]MCB9709296.1 chromosome segregation protein SMC [Myxococcales bacterium]